MNEHNTAPLATCPCQSLPAFFPGVVGLLQRAEAEGYVGNISALFRKDGRKNRRRGKT